MTHFDYRPAYKRNLPHIQPPGATFFITFRLAGSLPKSVVKQWNREQAWLSHLAETNFTHYQKVRIDYERKWFAKFESLLDESTTGPVWLRQDRIASLIAESLHHRDGKVYRLDAFTIMANHVHTVIKPLKIIGTEDYYSLAKIMQSLKGFTARRANSVLGREGEFWAHESYDHWIRNATERQKIVAYVLNNPVKAHCVNRWQEWNWSYRRSVSRTVERQRLVRSSPGLE